MKSLTASVYLLRAPYAIDRPFDYLVPSALSESIARGSIVTVPFGRGDKRVQGVVFGVREKEGDAPLKEIISVLSDAYALSEEQMALCEFLCAHTLCTVGEAVYTVLPSSVRKGRENLSFLRTVRLAMEKSEAHACASRTRASASRARVIETLAGGGAMTVAELCEQAEVGEGLVRTMLSLGILAEEKKELLRDPYAHLASGGEREAIVLTTAQMKAREQLLSLYEQEKALCALLFGVTGSGKTKVILSLIDRVLEDGKSVIMLVPEIALTPQTIGIFYRRYGSLAAVLHSSLSEGERFDTWRRVSRGDARIVIGTRSAIFAPTDNLGLIVIDEAHEHTYKSDRNPKYAARDVAAARAARHKCPVILASATPLVEDFERARRGVYTPVYLRERFGGRPLPTCETVDMRAELESGNKSPISRSLYTALADVLARGEQAILFLNRRGYSATLQCKKCGEVVSCPHCSLALTYHTAPYPRMLCHTCGYSAHVPHACASCGNTVLSHVGFGTEKIETELNQLLPNARILRMDADTTGQKGAFDRILDAFRRREADILLGTQMVTKGHDFPSVSLVAVLLADTSLYAPDFRAGERTFSLLTQVIGRAGRADTEGRAIIQTYTPKNSLLSLACAQDYEAFYEGEIAWRKAALFPPYCDMAALTVTARKEERALALATEVFELLKGKAEGEYRDQPLQIFGPFEAQIYRERDQYRLRIVVKCKLNSRVRALFAACLAAYAGERDATVSVDLSPSIL